MSKIVQIRQRKVKEQDRCWLRRNHQASGPEGPSHTVSEAGSRGSRKDGPRMPRKRVSLERRQYVISLGKWEKGEQMGGTVEKWDRMRGGTGQSHWRRGPSRKLSRSEMERAGKVCIYPMVHLPVTSY